MRKSSKIFIAGAAGMVGSALVRKLVALGYDNLIGSINKRGMADTAAITLKPVDLTRQATVEQFFSQEQPEYVFLAAAKVGGIIANQSYPADFIYRNLAIQNNVIYAAYQNGVKKLLFLGSSCIYPKLCPQPIQEEYLLSGSLEPTNEAYAIAKIAGLKMCQAFNRQYGTRYISVMPTNLYGVNDNFDLETSHVVPALIRKFHEAKIESKPRVVIWGTGKPRRELLHADDLADACVYLMNHYEASETINIGTGKDITIRELAELIADIVGFQGELEFDTGKPDGTPLKCLNVSKLTALGWQARIDLSQGIRHTYEWYLKQKTLP